MTESITKKNRHDNTTLKFESQQKWKKLEQKYKQYISLLKKKVDSYEQKFAMMSKQSTTELSNQHINKTVIIKLCFRIKNLEYKQLWNAFQKIKSEIVPKISSISELKLFRLDSNIIKSESKTEKSVQSKHRNISKEKKIPKMSLFVLTLTKILNHKKILKYAFNKLKQIRITDIIQMRKNQLDIVHKLQKKIKLKLFVSFNYLKIIQNSTLKTLKNCEQQVNYLKYLLSFDQMMYKLSSQKKYNKYSLIYLQNCKLKSQIENLQVQIVNLKEELAYRAIQREKDMIKKSEGLEQLADELREKDQLIFEYERQLQVHKAIKQKKILILSASEYEIQKRRLQDINQRLNEQNKFQEQMLQSQKQKYETQLCRLRQILEFESQQKTHLLNEIEELKQYKFQNEYEKACIAIDKQHLYQLQNNLNKRQSLFCYELRQFQKCNKCHDVRQNFPANLEYLKYIEKFQIISIIQRYLNGDYQVSLDFFKDINIIDRLNQIKYNIEQLKQDKSKQNNMLIKIPSKSKLNEKEVQEDQVLILKNNGEALKEICLYFQPIKIEYNENQSITSSSQTKIEGNQLKQEIKKNQQKILSLKQKLMYIRQSLLQFLKLLHLENSFSKQCKQILQSILQFFQYSQIQRKAIFGKRKASFLALFE